MTTLDPHARHVLDLMASSGYPTLDTMEPPQARIAADLGFPPLQSPKPDVAEARDLAAPGPGGPIPLRLYRPAGSKPHFKLPALIYIHGGGFTIGNIALYDVLCRRLANESRCAVVSVEYRLAPEAKFPAAVEDCYAAAKWISDNAASLGVDPARIAIGGDSAGGNLSAVTCLLARDHGGPRIGLQVLIYPATDMRGASDSHRTLADGYFLTGALMAWFRGHYMKGEADLSDWRMSPLLAESLAGLPPAWLMVCGFDPLRDEGLAYAQRLQQAGVPVTLRNYEGQIHGFLSMDAAIPDATKAIVEIGAALRSAFS